jgi:hypothetical protein
MSVAGRDEEPSSSGKRLGVGEGWGVISGWGGSLGWGEGGMSAVGVGTTPGAGDSLGVADSLGVGMASFAAPSLEYVAHDVEKAKIKEKNRQMVIIFFIDYPPFVEVSFAFSESPLTIRRVKSIFME